LPWLPLGVPSLPSSPVTEVYNPKAFILHAALLGQGFPHCPIFLPAASRRSLDRVSVPVWPVSLSARLPIVGLVGRYPANCLMGREPLRNRIAPFTSVPCGPVVLCGISVRFQTLSPCLGQVVHVLLTRPPLGCIAAPSFDLHGSSTPPAFVLSQDQTLMFKSYAHIHFHGLNSSKELRCSFTALSAMRLSRGGSLRMRSV
jgi:hypothetical protein